jgi:gliding motility-associated-like protein
VLVTGLPGFPEMKFPNVMTPNNDGKNDIFKGSGPEVTDYELTVFNRWGKVVFTSTDPEQAWIGITNGNQAIEGVYYFIARYKTVCSRNQTIEQSGSVTILR